MSVYGYGVNTCFKKKKNINGTIQVTLVIRPLNNLTINVIVANFYPYI